MEGAEGLGRKCGKTIEWGDFAQRELAQPSCNSRFAATRVSRQKEITRCQLFRQPIIYRLEDPSATGKMLGALNHVGGEVNHRVWCLCHSLPPRCIPVPYPQCTPSPTGLKQLLPAPSRQKEARSVDPFPNLQSNAYSISIH